MQTVNSKNRNNKIRNHKNRAVRGLAVTISAGLAVAACGGDTTDTAGTAPTDTSNPETSNSETSNPTGETATTGASDNPFDLSGVCPDPLVIQTDWFPESEHGSLYQMIGQDYTYDALQQRTTGSLVATDELIDTGINLEVRAGGPAVGYVPPRAQIYTDDSIHIAYANSDAQAQSWETAPLVALIAPLEINPQIIMWDADQYPDVETIADVGDAGMTVNLFTATGFAEVFAAQGIWSADQIDASYDGGPTRFIADPTIAQQGFASAEPYNYEFVFEEYGKAPKWQLVHDAGWEIYSQWLAVQPDDVEALAPCWEKFIPIVQQAIIDFAADPTRANNTIIDIVAQTDSFWVYDEGIAEYAVNTMDELGLYGNGDDDIVGNIDAKRIQRVLEQMVAADVEGLPDDLVAQDLFTNEFIDESIGF